MAPIPDGRLRALIGNEMAGKAGTPVADREMSLPSQAGKIFKIFDYFKDFPP